MPTIKIENIGGLMPSASPRRIGANNAQTNNNLFQGTSEFRPLHTDATVTSSGDSVRSMYRFAREFGGAPNTTPSDGWLFFSEDRNVVKGQINDDLTERVYITYNDGSTPPGATDNSGATRTLGVPRPTKPTVTLQAGADFTLETATAFVQGVVSNAVTDAIKAALPPRAESASRMVGGPLGLGPTSNYGLLFSRDVPGLESIPWTMVYHIPNPAKLEQLGATESDVASTGIALYIPIVCLPGVYELNVPAMTASLQAIVYPPESGDIAGTPVFNTEMITRNVNAARDRIDMVKVAVAEREELDRVVADFARITVGGLPPPEPAGPQPLVPPVVPRVPRMYRPSWVPREELVPHPQWIAYDLALEVYNQARVSPLVTPTVPTVDEFDFDSNRHPQWVAYDRQMVIFGVLTFNATPVPPTVSETNFEGERTPAWFAYDFRVLIWNAYQGLLTATANAAALIATTNTSASGSTIANIRLLRDRAVVLTQRIERLSLDAYSALTDPASVVDFINSMGGALELVGADNIIERRIESRSYVVAFVTDWGEESAPSRVSDFLEMDQNDAALVSRPMTWQGSTQFSNWNITHWRLYRTNAGSNSASFQFVVELPIGSLSYSDSKLSGELGEVCPSITWNEPPYRVPVNYTGDDRPPESGSAPYLRGLVGMPNGVMAGFLDNTVAFCEPYYPYAWPVEYQITTEYPIVGLGVFGQTLFVGTTGNSYFISGADSASMSAQKLDSPQSCASAKSIVPVEGGVIFASPDGLCLASPNGIQVLTQGAYTREDWQALDPTTMMGAVHEGVYYLFLGATVVDPHDYGYGGSQPPPPPNPADKAIAFDLITKKIGTVGIPGVTAVLTDLMTDTMYIAQGSEILAAFQGQEYRMAEYKSGLMTLPAQSQMAWVSVYGDQSSNFPVTVKWYGDGQLRHTAVFTDLKPQRLPSGRYLEHEVAVVSDTRVTSVVLAGSVAELQSI